MRCASRVSPSRASSVASCSPAANCSGHARTTVETAPSFSAERATSAARSFTAPARREMEPALRNRAVRSEEHTSELQSRLHLVCRLLLEKKKRKNITTDKQYHEHQR